MNWPDRIVMDQLQDSYEIKNHVKIKQTCKLSTFIYFEFLDTFRVFELSQGVHVQFGNHLSNFLLVPPEILLLKKSKHILIFSCIYTWANVTRESIILHLNFTFLPVFFFYLSPKLNIKFTRSDQIFRDLVGLMSFKKIIIIKSMKFHQKYVFYRR